MKIFKWVLTVTDKQSLLMPAGAKILDVQTQGDSCCLWALCDQNARQEGRYFAIYGTGNPTPDEPGQYIATFQLASGQLVFHVFETTGEKQ
jgi:hypothetical protein